MLLSSERVDMQIGVVFNPWSGKRAARRALSEVLDALASPDHSLTLINCNEHPDFERMLQNAVPELDRVVVIGGDGTLGSVVNAVVMSDRPEVPVAFVPTGRGRDAARSLSSWTALSMASRRFISADSMPIDLIKITLQDGTERYSINLSSIGVGAHAAAFANRLPRLFGSVSYVLGAARGFVPLRPFHTSLTADDEQIEFENALLVAACNGRSFGGGIHIAPHAKPDDGLLELVVASNANLADLALQLGKLKSGVPFDHPALSRWKARVIEIDPTDTIHYEADGEALCSQPVRYEIAPGALNWVTP